MPYNQNKVLARNLSLSQLGGIRLSAYVRDGKGVLTPRRTLSRYTLVYLLKGSGSYRDQDGRRCKVKPGDCILVLPGQEHWYGPDNGETWDEIFIEFEGAVFDLWRDSNYLDMAAPVFTLEPVDYWQARFLSAADKSHDSDLNGMLSEVVRLQSLLADIRSASRQDHVDELKWLTLAKQALSSHADCEVAAKSIGMSYEAFRKRFRKLAGMPPRKYQISLAMEDACDLLLSETNTIREIASILGYCDEYHFSKQFRKTIGWSPSEYRSRISEN